MKKNNLFLLSMLLVAELLFSGCNSKPLPLAEEDSISPSLPIETKLIETNPSETSLSEADSSESDITVSEEVEEAPPAPEPEVSIIMVGDILLHTPVEESCKKEDGTYDYSSLFANTKTLISDADIALVNQEVILGGEQLGVSGYPAFNAPFSVGDALVDSGFDIVCHATNHALDKGKTGLLNCVEYWEETHPEIGLLGIHESSEDQSDIYYVTKNDITIAFLNFTYGTNGIALPEGMPYAVDLLEKEQMLPLLKEARENADYLVVCPHWGTEYRLEPDASQKKWTDFFLENNVDLVLGTHPHVIEPIELLTDETTGHEMLVYYSLGNYVNWTSGTGDGVANRMVGGMATISIKRLENGTVTLSDYDIIPLVSHVTAGENGVTVYPLSEYTEELAAENEIRKQDSHFSYEYCIELCQKVWGEFF